MTEINRIGLVMQLLYAFILFERIISAKATPTTPTTPCKQQNEQNSMNIMWGDVNPNVYYICDPETNITKQIHCPEGRGFFNGLGYYGCIPFKDWPACISFNVRRHKQRNNTDIPIVQCDNEHLLEPWEANDPNKFYMCVNTNIDPVLVNCEIGKGFVSTMMMATLRTSNSSNSRSGNSSNSKIVGCASWEKWRAYMQCEEYY